MSAATHRRQQLNHSLVSTSLTWAVTKALQLYLDFQWVSTSTQCNCIQLRDVPIVMVICCTLQYHAIQYTTNTTNSGLKMTLAWHTDNKVWFFELHKRDLLQGCYTLYCHPLVTMVAVLCKGGVQAVQELLWLLLVIGLKQRYLENKIKVNS